MSRGQSKDRKLVDGLPPFSPVADSFCASESAEFAGRNLFLRGTQFPFVSNVGEYGDSLRVETGIEVVGINGELWACVRKL